MVESIRFTPRETEILKLVHEGLMAKEIAYLLGISKRTVEVHCANIRAKAGVFQTRLVELPEPIVGAMK